MHILDLNQVVTSLTEHCSELGNFTLLEQAYSREVINERGAVGHSAITVALKCVSLLQPCLAGRQKPMSPNLSIFLCSIRFLTPRSISPWNSRGNMVEQAWGNYFVSFRLT